MARARAGVLPVPVVTVNLPAARGRVTRAAEPGERARAGVELFAGKRVLVFGVANERSIAWGITQAMRRHGGRIALTYLNEALEKRVRPLGEEIGAELI